MFVVVVGNAAAAVEDRIDAAAVEPAVAAVEVEDNDTAAVAAVAPVAGADNRHRTRLVVARQRASNLE